MRPGNLGARIVAMLLSSAHLKAIRFSIRDRFNSGSVYVYLSLAICMSGYYFYNKFYHSQL